MIQRRLVVKLKLPRELNSDLNKGLKRWPAKPRTPRLPTPLPPPVLGVSSSDKSNPQVLIGSEATVQPHSEKMIGFADDDSRNLKRKFDQTERGDGEIRESDEIDMDEIRKTSISREGCSDDGRVADVKNLQIVSSPKRYACDVCSKTFSSHQAMGGHKSSHFKFTMRIYDAIDHLKPKKQLKNLISSPREPVVLGDDNRAVTHTYSCKICLKKFPSGQALGGHQRRHWTGHDIKTPKILDFDLNELPTQSVESHSGVGN